MTKRAPRLHFTDADRADPVLEKAFRRADKAADRLEKATSSIPKQTIRTKERTVDPKTGRVSVRLCFEEVDKKKLPSKLAHTALYAPGEALLSQVHQRIRRSEDDNAGVKATHQLEQAAESSVRVSRSLYRSSTLKPFRKAVQAEARSDKANLYALYQKAVRDNPKAFSNPLSRMQQKQAIKKGYAAAKAGKSTGAVKTATAHAGNAVKKAADLAKRAAELLASNKEAVLIAAALFLVLVIFMNTLSSCSTLFQAGIQSIAATTYPSTDEAMLNAEADYAAKEAVLQNEMDDFANLHPGYDEYHYDLAEIAHDPYVLISILTALRGEFAQNGVQDVLSVLFEKQYILSQTVKKEIRSRQEPDGSGGVKNVQYDYSICHVKLENFNLSHVPIYIMSKDELGLYAMYISTHGNRPDLFPQSQFSNAAVLGEYMHYDVPKQYLQDKTFAAILTEAEKYLGYPYVWGGYCPTTSFDCSGFVSWVLTNSGVLNTGRLGAEGLYNICTPISAAEAKPGDLVFFAGTYDVTGVSHVGIYVGDGMMIQAGNPIGYTSIKSDYWQSHLYAFGRLPIN